MDKHAFNTGHTEAAMICQHAKDESVGAHTTGALPLCPNPPGTCSASGDPAVRCLNNKKAELHPNTSSDMAGERLVAATLTTLPLVLRYRWVNTGHTKNDRTLNYWPQ